MKVGIQFETERELALLPHEVEARKDEILSLLKKRSEVALEKKIRMGEYTKRINGLDETIERTRASVESMKETRKMWVVWTERDGRAVLVPLSDRDRVLEQRPLEEHEKQKELFPKKEGEGVDEQQTPEGDAGGSGEDPPPAEGEGAGGKIGPGAEKEGIHSFPADEAMTPFDDYDDEEGEPPSDIEDGVPLPGAKKKKRSPRSS